MKSFIDKDSKEKFIESLGGPSIEIISDEFDLDNLDGLLRYIPIVKYGWELRKGILLVREHFFMKKVVRFIKFLKYDEVDSDFTNKFKDKLNENNKFQYEVAEKALIYLENFDEETKADIFARIFSELYINTKFTWELFNELSMTLNKIFIYDIQTILFIDDLNNYGSEIVTKSKIMNNLNSGINIDCSIERLLNLGLIKENEKGTTYSAISNNINSKITISSLGNQFIEYGKLREINFK